MEQVYGALPNVFDFAFACGLVIALVSGLIHGYTGFGGALLMVPLLAFLFGPVEAVVIVGIIIVGGSVQLYPSAARLAHWPELLPIFCGVVVFTPLGAQLLISLDADLIRRSMGVLILIFAAVLISGWVYRGPRGLVPSGFVGVLSGIIAGSSGVGGPPIALYFLSSAQPADSQRANIVIGISVLTTVMLLSVVVGGGATWASLVRALFFAPAYVFGIWAGIRLFALAPKAYFKRIALLSLVGTGIAAILF